MKVTALRKKLVELAEQAHPAVYYESAPDDARYPYAVLTLSNSVNSFLHYEQYVLDIDGWDAPRTGDTTELEQMMQAVDAALHRRTFIADGCSATLYREDRQGILDPDKKIKRRKYVYQVRVHG